MTPQITPRSVGAAAAAQLTVVGKRFGKSHADPCANGGGETDTERIPTVACGKSRGE
jgi:hypothetical protein